MCVCVCVCVCVSSSRVTTGMVYQYGGVMNPFYLNVKIVIIKS